MEDLDKLINLRDSIQLLDKQILEKLCERVLYAKEIGEIKKKNGKPIYVPEVEKKKIEELSALSAYPGLVETIWPVIMCYTRSVE
jgi:chorismate mutase/prephenate dehydratase